MTMEISQHVLRWTTYPLACLSCSNRKLLSF